MLDVEVRRPTLDDVFLTLTGHAPRRSATTDRASQDGSTSHDTLDRRMDRVQGSLVEAGRHLRIIPRNIELLIFATVQPIMFVLLFVYVFGGAIEVPGFDELQPVPDPGHLQPDPGVRFGVHGIGLAEDLSKGLVDRLRSLPMSQRRC